MVGDGSDGGAVGGKGHGGGDHDDGIRLTP